ncbi:MAG TPA: lipoyl synthase [Chloroflexi bacterium]|nr:lipoyl synthase [Chloroflexota bacterium]
MDAVSVFRLGTVAYEVASRLQEEVAQARAAGDIGDVLLVLQHPPVITVGRGGGEEDILAPASLLRQAGVRVLPTDRGGRATYHGPGQLVVYPILTLPDGDLYNYIWRLEEAVVRLLNSYGLPTGRLDEHPGVWVNPSTGSGHGGGKIAAVGLAVRDGITRHGLALNVAPRMAHFDLLIPCGITDHGVTSMERELGQAPGLAEVTDRFVRAFAEVFGCQVVEEDPETLRVFKTRRVLEEEQPFWLWQRVSAGAEIAVGRMERLLADLSLHTVCQEARCPNVAECFGRGTATFMILGDTCTRGCRFCAVKRGRPTPLDRLDNEPERVAEAAARLGLRHVVVTSVTRDDLPDGGASRFAATVQAMRCRLLDAAVEVLIPDFNGSCAALEVVLDARPDVLNHNLETVPRLYPQVRPGADYRRSLGVLAWAKTRAPQVTTKSGLMLGLGERTAEVLQVLYDLRQAQCDLLTLGQYLQPTARQFPVARYVPPAEFDWYREKAEAFGFRGVAAGPLVRSSHRAEDLWAAVN